MRPWIRPASPAGRFRVTTPCDAPFPAYFLVLKQINSAAVGEENGLAQRLPSAESGVMIVFIILGHWVNSHRKFISKCYQNGGFDTKSFYKDFTQPPGLGYIKHRYIKISNSSLVGCFCIALLHNTLLKSIMILCSTWFEGSQYTIIIAQLCRSWVRLPLMF